MKMYILSDFDCGKSFSFDDKIFTNDVISKMKGITDSKLNFPPFKEIYSSKNESEIFGIYQDAPAGLKFILSEEIINIWKLGAQEYVKSSEGLELFKLDLNVREDKEIADKIIEQINLSDPVSATITLNALGVALVSLRIENIDLQKFLIGVFQSYENSGYYKISRIILKIFSEIHAILNLENQLLQKVSVRDNFNEIKEYDLLKGFSLIAIIEKNEDEKTLYDILRKFECTEDFHNVELDSGNLQMGWRASFFKPDGENEVDINDQIEVLMWLFQTCYFLDAICNAYEKLYFKQSNDIAYFDKSKIIDEKKLNFLKISSMIVVQLTHFNLYTINNSNRAFFDAFNYYSRIEEKQKNIKVLSSEYEKNCKEILRMEERRKSKNLNILITIIAVSTLASVMADIIGTCDYTNAVISNSFLRLAIILSPSIVVAIIGYKRYRR